ncbi:MAG: hypothetical protein K8I82_23090 [Anaerolineae bacterium]|nr:hypothetical protein [Anaerolineae bacterium]
MERYALRREHDGLIIAPAVMAEPEASWKIARQNKAAVDFGGVWQMVTLDADTYQQIKNKLAAGKAAYLVAGEITSQGAPTLSVDKSQILANDTDATILTIEVGSNAGMARYTILTPEGGEIRGAEPFTAGVAVLTLTTEQVGRHVIGVDVLEYGRAEITIEGVE